MKQLTLPYIKGMLNAQLTNGFKHFFETKSRTLANINLFILELECEIEDKAADGLDTARLEDLLTIMQDVEDIIENMEKRDTNLELISQIENAIELIESYK